MSALRQQFRKADEDIGSWSSMYTDKIPEQCWINEIKA
jgi:hypothetical protein